MTHSTEQLNRLLICHSPDHVDSHRHGDNCWMGVSAGHELPDHPGLPSMVLCVQNKAVAEERTVRIRRSTAGDNGRIWPGSQKRHHARPGSWQRRGGAVASWGVNLQIATFSSKVLKTQTPRLTLSETQHLLQ